MGFWIPSDSEEALVDGFHRIGSLLDVDVGDSEDPALAVKQWLEGSQDWLLIFDGADDPKLLKRFLPVRGKGHILITSRRQAFDDIGISKPGTITGLTLEEAVGFMLRRTGRGDLTDEEDRALRSMLTRIDGLPLALEQAGAYILRVRCSFGEYLSRYEARGLSLLERFPPRAPGYQESVATTWALNFEEIEKSSKATADVLRISAFLNSDSIPFKVFVGGAQAFGERTAKILRENEFDEVLEPALEYSLVAREIGALAFSVHPMVQEVLRGGMSESEESEWAKRVIRAVREVLSNPELDHWRPSEELIPSAVSCGKLIRERGFRFPEAIILMKKLATHLYLLARYSESESILSWVISNSRGDVDLAMCLNGVGMLSMKRKHYEEGENYFKQALALIIRTFGPESPEQAVVLDNLGQLYLQTRRYGEAETCLKTAFNLHEQNLVLKINDFAASLNSLSTFYFYRKRIAEAAPLLHRAIKLLEGLLGPEHPRLAGVMANLAAVKHDSGELTEAEDLYKRALAMSEKTLGPEHPDLAQILWNLAMFYVDQGDREKVEYYQRRAEAIEKKCSESE